FNESWKSAQNGGITRQIWENSLQNSTPITAVKCLEILSATQKEVDEDGEHSGKGQPGWSTGPLFKSKLILLAKTAN
ncbi:MAG: hypothetical protein LBS68_03475, partial [Puniceicoccales bacterium]|nr:hypothetical protein [Puniceicoccales bacterium]